MYIVYRAVFTRTGGFVFIWKSQIYYVEVKLHNALFPINSCYSQENYVEVKFQLPINYQYKNNILEISIRINIIYLKF